MESNFLKHHTITEYLSFRNSKEEDLRNKDQYLNLTAKFVNDTTDVGIRFVSKWWERNLMMMSHVDRIAQPEDRILLIVGAAHRALLKDFFEDRTDVNYVEINNYLMTPIKN